MIDLTIFNSLVNSEVDVKNEQLIINPQKRRGEGGVVLWSDAAVERCHLFLSSLDLKRNDFSVVQRETLITMASRFHLHHLNNSTFRKVECLIYRCLLDTDEFSDEEILKLVDTGAPLDYLQKIVGEIGNIKIF